ncbi:MAG: hypothetical protein Q9212_003616 [Teloschistes hypoglaucus]
MGKQPNLYAFDDTSALAKALRTYVVQCQNAGLERHSLFKVAVSGGSLPATLAKGLLEPSQGPEDVVDFAKWEIFFADERAVPLDHADSNYKVLKDELLDKIPKGAGQPKVHPIDLKCLDDVQEMADQYQESLMQSFAAKDSVKLPIFDLLLLGCGPDGHTCSLFPNHELLRESDAWVAPIEDSPKPPAKRITLSLPVVTHGIKIAFVATGAGKKDILRQIFDTEEGRSLPCGLVNEGGADKVPETVIMNKDSWSIIKDLIRNVINGQPGNVKAVEEQRMYICTMHRLEDALQAYENLAGRDWYRVIGNTSQSYSSTLTVACSRGQQNQYIRGPTTVTVTQTATRDPKRLTRTRRDSRSTTHSRTSSTSSSMSSNMQVPHSPRTLTCGPSSPMYGGSNYSQGLIAVPHPMAAQVAHPTMTHLQFPRPVIGQPHHLGSTAHLQPRAVAVEPQPSARIGPPTSQQSAGFAVHHKEIIMLNLPTDTTDGRLKQWLTQSVGLVDECRINERGEKKRHAFVTFAHEAHAKMAVETLDKSEWCGREITVRLTKEGVKGPVIINGSIEE